MMPPDRYAEFVKDVKKITFGDDTVAHKSIQLRALLKGAVSYN